MTMVDTLDRGRESFRRRLWAEAFAQLSAADRDSPLEPADLDLLATAAFLVGRDEDGAELLARAYRESSTAQDDRRRPPAARSGWPFTCCRRAIPRRRPVGWPGPGGSSAIARRTASSRDICCSRPRWRSTSRATTDPLTPSRAGPPRSATASATWIW